jgi:hypothetical protein
MTNNGQQINLSAADALALVRWAIIGACVGARAHAAAMLATLATEPGHWRAIARDLDAKYTHAWSWSEFAEAARRLANGDAEGACAALAEAEGISTPEWVAGALAQRAAEGAVA